MNAIEILPPGSGENNDPAAWAGRIGAAWQKSTEAIFETGRLLIAAKAALPHGEFTDMLETKVRFGVRMAQMLMAVAGDARLTNANHGSLLPPSWRTLYELTKLDDTTLERRFADGSITPELERKTISLLAKSERRTEREQVLAEKITALPEKKYGLIYADPEWRFEPYSRETGMDRAADNHYPTSALIDLMRRDVRAIAADDCVLFLWATVPMLIEAICVLDAWGFALINRDTETGFLMPDPKAEGRYKSHVAWRKCEIDASEGAPEKRDRGRYSTGLVLGTGYWFRNAHELLLVATRGNVPAPAMGTQFASIIDATPLRHSQKPERFHELIESYFPNLPKIELNARAQRPGWDCWGLEAPDPCRGNLSGGEISAHQGHEAYGRMAEKPQDAPLTEVDIAPFTWTKDAEAVLRAGYADKIRVDEIAKTLGIGRGAVFGKANRLGLTDRSRMAEVGRAAAKRNADHRFKKEV